MTNWDQPSLGMNIKGGIFRNKVISSSNSVEHMYFWHPHSLVTSKVCILEIPEVQSTYGLQYLKNKWHVFKKWHPCEYARLNVQEKGFLFHETVLCCFRGCLKVPNDTKSILNDSKGGHSCSFRTNWASFRTFRRPLFPKPVSRLGLFCRFLQQDSYRFFNNDDKCHPWPERSLRSKSSK